MEFVRPGIATIAVALAVALALSTTPVAAQTPTTDAFGRVLAYTPPTATSSGSITIGTRTFTLAPGSATPTSSVNPTPQVTVGADVWFFGDRSAAGVFTTFSVRPMEGICGVVTAFTPSTGTAHGSITVGETRPVTLPIAAGVTFSQTQVTGHQCYPLAVDAQGDAQIIGHTVQPVAVGGAAPTPQVLACGRVVAYTPPTATSAGSITLGTTTFTLKAGSLPTSPPPIAVGAIVCMDENPAGEVLAQTHLVGDTICGQLTALSPASITLQGNRTRIIPVRSGTSLAGAQVGANGCFNFAINAAGNAEVVDFVGPHPTQAAAPAQPLTPRQLPSTSTAPGISVPALGLAGLLLAVGITWLRMRIKRSGRISESL